MGLLDRFRRPPDQPPEHIAELYRRAGKLEAGLSSLELQWQSYRDELRRLVQRLEKRDQRAASSAPEPAGDAIEAEPDPITAAIHARRSRRLHVPRRLHG